MSNQLKAFIRGSWQDATPPKAIFAVGGWAGMELWKGMRKQADLPEAQGAHCYGGCFSPDGAYFWIGKQADPWVLRYDTSTWPYTYDPVSLTTTPTYAHDIRWNRKGDKFVIMGYPSDTVGTAVYKTLDNSDITQIQFPSTSMIHEDVSFSRDDSMMALAGIQSGHAEGYLYVYNVSWGATWSKVSGAPLIEDDVDGLDFSPTEDILAITVRDHEYHETHDILRLFNTNTWAEITGSTGVDTTWLTGQGRACRFSNDGTRFAISDGLGRIMIFQTSDWSELYRNEFEENYQTITGIDWDPTDRYILLAMAATPPGPFMKVLDSAYGYREVWYDTGPDNDGFVAAWDTKMDLEWELVPEYEWVGSKQQVHDGDVYDSINQGWMDSSGYVHILEFNWGDTSEAIYYHTNSSGSWVSVDTGVTTDYSVIFDGAMDSSNKMYAAYIDFNSGSYTWNNFVKFYNHINFLTNKSGSWVETTAIDLSGEANEFATYPEIEVDNSGNIHMIFQQVTKYSSYARLMYTMWNGSTWSTPETVISQIYQSGNDNDIDSTSLKNRLAVNSDGSVVMVAGLSSSGSYFNSWKRSGGSWGSKVLIGSNPASTTSRAGIIWTSSNNFELWGSTTTSPYRIWKITYNGSIWDSSFTYMTDATDAYRLASNSYVSTVKIDAQGRRYLTYDYGGGGGCLWSDNGTQMHDLNLAALDGNTWTGYLDDLHIFGYKTHERFAAVAEFEDDDAKNYTQNINRTY